MKSVYKRKRKSPISNESSKRGRLMSTFRSGWERRSSVADSRRDGLLQQFTHRNKTSIVVDSRIGERSVTDEDEKMARRMAAEKSKQYKKKSIFNLNDEDDEFLTHKGETIANVERYEDPRDQSGSDDELLDKDFVKEAHFGGFLKMKSGDPSDNPEEKSKKEIIQELILTSKAKKLEKAKQGDEYLSKVSDLNSMFKDDNIMSLVQKVPSKKDDLSSRLSQVMIRNDTSESNLESQPRASSSSESTTKVQVQPQASSSAEEVKRKSQVAADTEIMESPQDAKFGRIVRELKFDSKPARVDPIQAAGVVTSDDLGADWEVEVNLLKFKDVVIPSSYMEYTSFILANCKKPDTDEYDRELFCYINDQMINSHTVSHRGKLSDLLAYLLEFSLETANRIDIFRDDCLLAFTPYLFHRICTTSPNCAELADIFVERLRDAHETFKQSPKNLPNSVMFLITLCAHIFEIAEVRHRVISPVLILLFQILGEYKVTDGKTARQILQLCYDCYTFVQESRRYAPEILLSLCSLLKCFYSQERLPVETIGFPSLFKQRDDVYETYEIFLTLLTLIKKFIVLYSSYNTASDMFKPIRDALYILKNRAFVECEWPGEYSPEQFKKHVGHMLIALENLSKEREVPQTKFALPTPLRLYEPEFQEVFSGKKRSGTREQQDHNRLVHKIKKEHKGAIRELKKDGAFLARAQQREQSRLDATRIQKVRNIIGALSNQEGDFKKVCREKKK